MQFKDNTLLIVPNKIKENIIQEIRENNPLLDITFITKNEFIKKVTFDYDNKTIYYLMNKYNIKYEIAKVYLDNIYFVEDIKYESSKLNYLVEIKKDLIENNLLIFDNIYKEYIKTKHIVVYNFNYIDKYFNKLLSEFNDVEIINKKYNNYNIDTIYCYNTLEEEVNGVSVKICDLITSNIDINSIKIYYPSSYQNTINKIFKMYNIPINTNKSSIYDTYIGNYFIENLNKTIEDSINKIINYDEEIVSKIINILNKYTWCDNLLEVKDMLIYELKNTYIETKYNKSIELIDLKDNNITDNDYVFVLGFNQGEIPTIYKDEEYITDNITNVLNIENTLELNKIEYNIILSNLKSIKNLNLSYKLNSDNGVCYISSMSEVLNSNIENIEINNYKYSNKLNKTNLTKYLDKLVNYGIKEDNLELLYSNYDVNYKSFDNKYTLISKDNLYKFINNKLLLSYSSLDNYNKCSFKYYLSNILKISIYEETFMTSIGTIFHEVLSKMNNEDFDFLYKKKRKNVF